MQKQQQNIAAIYCRLSRDDGGDAESNSIQNQKMLLNKYAREHGFCVYSEYVDDGVSGTTFERDSFKRMVADIEDEKFGIVICKDLSRLGRNNALVAFYTEIFFFEHNIRFICVNDGIDSAKGDNEMMGFRSIINEYYARDISKKIRSVKEVQSQLGKRLGGKAPYGYMIDPNDKHHLIINPEIAPIVRRIFQMSADGIGTPTIAKTLTLDGIPTPKEVWSGEYTGKEWTAPNLCTMLRNKVYIGHIVSNKLNKPSFKSNKAIRTDPSEWVDVPGMHEPIIEQKIFDLVQRRLPIKKRPNTSRNENIFVGMVKCADCGSNLGYARNTYSGIVYLCCHNYRKVAKEKCSPHYIQYEQLKQLVLEAIRENAAIVKANEHRLEDFIRQSLAGHSDKSKKSDRAALTKLTRRKDELDQIIKRLFEENVLGNMPSERFYEMSSGYETEIKDVTSRINKLNAALSEETDNESNYRHFFEIMRNYIEVETLDTTMLYNLIDHIDVHAPVGRHPNRTQQVDIHYKFIDEGLSSPQN